MRIIIKGYTLLEILIVLSIGAFVLALMVPSWQYFFRSTSAELAAAELYTALQTARDEAILRKRPVTVCKSSDQQTCSGEWRDGFIVKIGRSLIYSHRYSLSQGRILWRAFPSQNRNLVFLSSGFSKLQNGTFWFCFEENKNPSWAIVLNQSGRVRRVDPDKFGNIYDDKNGLIKC